MDVLVLGGTQWLGREIAATALARGHTVTCLARGESGDVAAGAEFVVGDRSRDDAYDGLGDRRFDQVVDVSWQPGFVRGALAALGERAAQWTYVSSGSVYADTATLDSDESVTRHDPIDTDTAEREQYSGAKVACEDAVTAAVGERALLARVGLIAGPGDHTDRTGYWVARAARAPREPMLVPDAPTLSTQVIDVRDLAAWLVLTGEQRSTGTVNAVGPVVPFGEWLTLCREVGGHTGDVVAAPRDWLEEHGVQEWAGDDSLPMWISAPDWAGFADRDGSRAATIGLVHRPRREVVVDTLAWEQEQGLDRPRRAGLSAAREAGLVVERRSANR